MKITVCQGSSCRINGADFVLEDLQQLLRKRGLEDQVELGRHGCAGMCRKGICVKLDGEKHAILPSDTQDFFEKNILPRL